MPIRQRIRSILVKHLAGQHDQLTHDPTPDWDAQDSKFEYEVVSHTSAVNKDLLDWRDQIGKVMSKFNQRYDFERFFGFRPNRDDLDQLDESATIQYNAVTFLLNRSGGSLQDDFQTEKTIVESRLQQAQDALDNATFKTDEYRKIWKKADQEYEDYDGDDEYTINVLSRRVSDAKYNFEEYEDYQKSYENDLEEVQNELDNLETSWEDGTYAKDHDSAYNEAVASTYRDSSGILQAFAVFSGKPEPNGEWYMEFMSVAPWNNPNASRIRDEETGKRVNIDRQIENLFGHKKDATASLKLALKICKDAVKSNSTLRFQPATDQVQKLYEFVGAKVVGREENMPVMTWDVNSMKKFIENYKGNS